MIVQWTELEEHKTSTTLNWHALATQLKNFKARNVI